MQYMNTNIFIRFLLLLIMMVSPPLVLAQAVSTDAKALHREIDKLSDMVERLKAEQAKADRIDSEMNSQATDFNKRDSLRLIALKRKQAESRARIDQITLDILEISKKLEDPGKRYALAQKMKQSRLGPKVEDPESSHDSTDVPQIVTARSIDLAAVKLVREGKSLDQARLLTIDALSNEQVLAFYQALDKADRYKLYDIADEIVSTENIELVDARRSALYFYLFTQ